MIRQGSPGARVGITLNLSPHYPASDSPEDREAVRRADGAGNRWFLDPVFRGEYPADMVEQLRDQMPAIEDGDLETIATPIDFLGVNNYSRHVWRADANGNPTPIVPKGPELSR